MWNIIKFCVLSILNRKNFSGIQISFLNIQVSFLILIVTCRLSFIFFKIQSRCYVLNIFKCLVNISFYISLIDVIHLDFIKQNTIRILFNGLLKIATIQFICFCFSLNCYCLLLNRFNCFYFSLFLSSLFHTDHNRWYYNLFLVLEDRHSFFVLKLIEFVLFCLIQLTTFCWLQLVLLFRVWR